MPGYLTVGQDGRIWSTDSHHPRRIGAITTAGQLTVYQERIGSERIPSSRIRALGNYGYTYVGASGGVLQGWGGEFFPFAYPSGLSDNRDIASGINGYTDVYFTECCLGSGGAIADYKLFQGIVEYPLPYPECASPAGMTYDTANATLYVACAGASDALLVSMTPSATASVAFPGNYVTRVDTVALAVDGSIYFATGSAPDLVRFNPSRGTFSMVPTPDGEHSAGRRPRRRRRARRDRRSRRPHLHVRSVACVTNGGTALRRRPRVAATRAPAVGRRCSIR